MVWKVADRPVYVTFSVGRCHRASLPVQSNPGSDTAFPDHSAEGHTDMTQCRRGQPYVSGRDAAVTITNLGTNRLSRHPECRFCLYPLSVVVPGSVLHLNSVREWWYICTLGGRCCCRAKVLWEMSAYIDWCGDRALMVLKQYSHNGELEERLLALCHPHREWIVWMDS